MICGDDEIDEDVLRAASKGLTKGISKYGVGTDKIDINAAEKLKIKIINCPGINSRTVAEHVFGLLLSYKKNIHREYIKTREGNWPRFLGSEIFDSKFGVLGFGNIGKRVAYLAKSFGCKVYCYDKMNNKKDNDFTFCNSIEELFQIVDIVSLHINLNESNHNIISKDLIFKHAKNGIIIINTARGKLVDEDAILLGIRENIISGYLADVLSEEPPIKKNNLLSNENTLITSHIASKTIENVSKQAVEAINNLSKILA